jgi:yeast amino acid transporter
MLVFYFAYKFFKKTRIVPLDELPIRHFIDIAKANPEPPPEPVTGWRRLNILWS